MIKAVSLECPSCGAPLNADRKASETVCSYCGTRVYLHDDRPLPPAKPADTRSPSRGPSAVNTPAIEKLRERFYLITLIFFIALIVIGFCLTGAEYDTDNFWVGIAIVGIIGAVAFSRKRKREFSANYLSALYRLSAGEYRLLSLYRRLELASIFLVLVSLAFSNYINDSVWCSLLTAGIVFWVVFNKKGKKIIPKNKT